MTRTTISTTIKTLGLALAFSFVSLSAAGAADIVNKPVHVANPIAIESIYTLAGMDGAACDQRPAFETEKDGKPVVQQVKVVVPDAERIKSDLQFNGAPTGNGCR